MGKRRRGGTVGHEQDTNQTDPSSSSLDAMPCSSGTELSREKSSQLLNASEVKPLSHGMDVTDSTLKLLNMHTSLAQQHYNLGRSIFLKRSRHHYGHHYSRRNSGNHANASNSQGRTAFLRDHGNYASASTSHGRTALLRDNSLKLIGQSGLDAGHHTDNGEKAFSRQGCGRCSSLVVDSASSDAVKMVCGICEKLLRRKPYFPGEEPSSSGEFSVVAVLACGHLYHADCLEERTGVEDIQDPPCPLCLGHSSQHDATVEE